MILNALSKSLLIALLTTSAAISQHKGTYVVLNADQSKETISRHIYGQFAEHLGHGIYGGIWVGPNSSIPNTRGIRNDVVAALKRIRIPNLRWPGGCFADEYHWMDGIGRREKRPKMVNTHWGGVTEDNSFGTHEFMDLCEQLGTEPYICGNVGSGSVEEMSKWVEYLTFDGESPMANLRRQNGREKPWAVKLWGVGNENWGCGGNMTAEFYADQYRRYATYCRNYGSNHLVKIAGGPSGGDLHWMETLMKNVPGRMMDGVSLHHYTVPKSWSDKGSATSFDEAEYFTTVEKSLRMNDLIRQHSTIMDRYDPSNKIGLMVDEWGNWYNVEPGTNPGFLFQQNTLRDAITAALNLNIFNNNARRVKIANIAQMVNVLQAMIFTDGARMVLTPTFYVYELYAIHHDAALIPTVVSSEDYEFGGRAVPAINVSASRDSAGHFNITLVNVDPVKERQVTCELRGSGAVAVTGSVVTGATLSAHNRFDAPENVFAAKFKDCSIKNNLLTVRMPPHSVVALQLR